MNNTQELYLQNVTDALGQAMNRADAFLGTVGRNLCNAQKENNVKENRKFPHETLHYSTTSDKPLHCLPPQMHCTPHLERSSAYGVSSLTNKNDFLSIEKYNEKGKVGNCSVYNNATINKHHRNLKEAVKSSCFALSDTISPRTDLSSGNISVDTYTTVNDEALFSDDMFESSEETNELSEINFSESTRQNKSISSKNSVPSEKYNMYPRWEQYTQTRPKKINSCCKTNDTNLKIIPTIMASTPQLRMGNPVDLSTRRAWSHASRGVVIDPVKNRRIRCDPVRRWKQYQLLWSQDRFLENLNGRKSDALGYQAYLDVFYNSALSTNKLALNVKEKSISS